jgi:hypothetical protein
MVANWKRGRHVLVFLALFIGAPCVLFAIWLPFRLMSSIAPIDVSSWTWYFLLPWLALAIGTLGIAAHTLVERFNPNRDLERNKMTAQVAIEKGKLCLGRRGFEPTEGTDPAGRTWSATHTLRYSLLVLLVLAFPVAEYLRVINGWPMNWGWVPGVVGPGDPGCLYFPDQLRTVKGHWNSTGSVTILNAAELGAPAEIPLLAKSDSWGERISGNIDEMEQTITMWAEFPVPDDPALAGKTLKLRFDEVVTYPTPAGRDRFDNVTENHSLTTDLRLATPHARQLYLAAYFCGLWALWPLFLVLSYSLSKLAMHHAAKGLPTTIVPPDGGDEN